MKYIQCEVITSLSRSWDVMLLCSNGTQVDTKRNDFHDVIGMNGQSLMNKIQTNLDAFEVADI